MIVPMRSDDEFLKDLADAPKVGLSVWWLGQSGFLVQCDGKRLLFDPYLSDSLTKKYAGTDKPHVRMTRRVIDPSRLTGIDLVTSSHNHTDHLDAETLNPIRSVNASMKLIIPEANRDFVARRLGCDPAWSVGIDAGQSAVVGSFELQAIASAHERLDCDVQGRHLYLGYIVRVGAWTLYHPGDCVPYSGLAEMLQPFAIDLAFMPINGRDPARGVAGNFDGREAAELAKAANFQMTVPCHYDMFEFNTVRPDLFVQSCRGLGVRHRVMQAGERINAAEL